MKKRITGILLITFLAVMLNVSIFADNLQIGADIGDILATDIVAKINDYVIPSFNIDNSMVIYARDLNKYGFDVLWDGEKRHVNISQNKTKRFEPIEVAESLGTPIGTKYGDVLYTDIKTFIDGKEIESFNINGSTAIYFRDLKSFGAVNWDDESRISSLTVENIKTEESKIIYEPSQISKLVSPAVVYVETYDEYGYDLSTGSGFIVDKLGLVVTNYHVIENAYTTIIKLVDGREFDVVDIMQYDVDRDVAVLKIDASNLSEVLLGNSDKVENGDKILTIGSPIGLENTIADGLISNKNRIYDEKSYFQISAPISSGSSGGALLNYSGEVIGITSATYIYGQNLNLAIPINEVKSYIISAIEGKKTDDYDIVSMIESAENAEYYIVEYSNGDKYIGEIKDDVFSGYGTYYWENGLVYEGEWSGNLPNGSGTKTWSNGDKHEGEFKDGVANGYGKTTWFDGEKYEGNILDGYRNGFGTYTWTDRDIYVGNWRSDFKYGRGTYYYSDATVLAGIWYEDEYIAEHVESPSYVIAEVLTSDDIWAYWDDVEYADYYYVYSSVSPDGPFERIVDSKGEALINDISMCFLEDINPNTTVYVAVSTVIDGEESELSEVVNATTYSKILTPKALMSVPISDSELAVKWNKIENVEGYFLYYSTSEDGDFEPYKDETGDLIKFDWYSDYCVSITDLEPNTTMYFKVKSVRANEISEFSDVFWGTTLSE